jgi:hypothetical protein
MNVEEALVAAPEQPVRLPDIEAGLATADIASKAAAQPRPVEILAEPTRQKGEIVRVAQRELGRPEVAIGEWLWTML